MNRIAVRLAVAFALVALLSVAAVGVAARWAVRSEFGWYLLAMRARVGAPGLEGGPQPMPPMMRRHWSGAMRIMMGLPERRFLDSVESVLWRVGAGAALAGGGLGVLMASTLTRRLREVANRALTLARVTHTALPGRGDEVDRVAEAFSTMEQALARQEQQRRQLLADVAHELRTPLAVLQANLESMLDGVTPLQLDRIAALHTQVELLGRLVHDLRDLAMAEAGELGLHRAPADLGELVEQAADLWRPHFEELGARLVVEREPIPPLELDADRMGQVLANLLSNAARHVPAGEGWVRLQVGVSPCQPRHEGGPAEVRVTVEDNGPGVDPASLPYLFDHFYRADRSRSRQTGGSGIGLAIVKSVVEAHGGRVWAANRPEGGALFGFALPATPP